MSKTANFNLDLKEYLQSDKFLKDTKDGKWDLGLDVLVEGTPVGLTAGATNAQASTFQQKVRAGRALKISDENASKITAKFPNIELARAYNECLGIYKKFGLFVEPKVFGDTVVFEVSFRKEFPRNPLPIVTSFEVRNTNDIQNAPVKGETLEEGAKIITCSLVSERELVFILETTQGVAIRSIKPPSKVSRDMPVGTIVASTLSPEVFFAVTLNDEANPNGKYWTAQFSKWTLADGKEVPYSKYSEIASVARVPDLRGMFLRGINEGRNDGNRDPDGDRDPGNVQLDTYPSHTHGVSIVLNAGGGVRAVNVANVVAQQGSVTTTGPSGGNVGTETRPKNAAVYYYIRIN